MSFPGEPPSDPVEERRDHVVRVLGFLAALFFAVAAVWYVVDDLSAGPGVVILLCLGGIALIGQTALVVLGWLK